MESNNRHLPVSLWLLMACNLLLGLGGIAGGLAMLFDPSGSSLGLSLSSLSGTPFRDYVLPGTFIFLVMGVFPLFVVYSLWTKPVWSNLDYLEFMDHEHWSWSMSLLLSVLVILWSGLEFILFGYQTPIQIAVALLGLLSLALAVLQPVRQFYAED
ncbi:MAG TPA: hypothetical protein VH186_04020 [Chloroflexia bacterium]|nr:hypothetical protein [Chloroflexia bacterium]